MSAIRLLFFSAALVVFSPVLPAQSTSSPAAQTARANGSVSSCPAAITLQGNSPGGGKLKGSFPAPVPASVLVYGTIDFGQVTGSSGKWISESRYANMQQKLLTFNASGTQIGDCSYDADGNLILFTVILSSYNLTLGSGGIVSVNWTSFVESGVDNYFIDRKLQAAPTYDPIYMVGPQFGAYSIPDLPPGPGSWSYRLRAQFTNGTQSILAEASITVQ